VDRYDLPAMLSHVMAVTGAERFHYIGHSMGTLSYYTACNYHPWIGRQFSSSFLLPFLLLLMRV
jgi:pimeloyl-ACP methyl ester carboxylesterase